MCRVSKPLSITLLKGWTPLRLFPASHITDVTDIGKVLPPNDSSVAQYTEPE
jgi:hypothetical protein